MGKIRDIAVVGFSVLVIASTAVGVYCAMRSDLFTVHEVDVSSSSDNPPLSSQDVIKLAAVPVGRVSIFELDLKAIQTRLLAVNWIYKVKLLKKPRHTLAIFVTYRIPRGIFQGKDGRLSYVDEFGKVFGSVNLANAPDLPLLVGLSEADPGKIHEALEIWSQWETSRLNKLSSISTIYWNEERGFRALITYTLENRNSELSNSHPVYVRTMIDFGHEINAELDSKLNELYNVFHYLSGNSIAVRQVWADAGKKIVVKTVHGS